MSYLVILFEILENGDNSIDLEEIEGGYNQYINIRLNNVVKTFVPETGEVTSYQKRWTIYGVLFFSRACQGERTPCVRCVRVCTGGR